MEQEYKIYKLMPNLTFQPVDPAISLPGASTARDALTQWLNGHRARQNGVDVEGEFLVRNTELDMIFSFIIRPSSDFVIIDRE